MPRPLRIALPVMVLAGGVAVAGILVATREKTEPKPVAEHAWPIEAVTVGFADLRPTLRFFGEVASAREVDLRALVAGPVTWVADEFADGGAVGAGSELVAIDPFDYREAVAERAAARDEARARLAEMRARLNAERDLLAEDSQQVAIGERDLARRESLVGSAVSERGLDEAQLTLSRARSGLIQRRRGVEALTAQVAQQEAVIARLEAALARAGRALDDTVLRAPFEGWLADTAAQVGKRLGVGDRIARLIDFTTLEARFHVTDSAFGRSLQDLIGRRAEVLWRLGPRTLRFDANVVRLEGEIDPGTGAVAAWARLDGGGFDALRPGAFVEVCVPDRLYRQVSRLPEAALHEGGIVYAVVDERLDARAVDVVGRDGDTILVNGELNDGDKVAVTRLTEIGPGLKVVLK